MTWVDAPANIKTGDLAGPYGKLKDSPRGPKLIWLKAVINQEDRPFSKMAKNISLEKVYVYYTYQRYVLRSNLTSW